MKREEIHAEIDMEQHFIVLVLVLDPYSELSFLHLRPRLKYPGLLTSILQTRYLSIGISIESCIMTDQQERLRATSYQKCCVMRLTQ